MKILFQDSHITDVVYEAGEPKLPSIRKFADMPLTIFPVSEESVTSPLTLDVWEYRVYLEMIDSTSPSSRRVIYKRYE